MPVTEETTNKIAALKAKFIAQREEFMGMYPEFEYAWDEMHTFNYNDRDAHVGCLVGVSHQLGDYLEEIGEYDDRLAIEGGFSRGRLFGDFEETRPEWFALGVEMNKLFNPIRAEEKYPERGGDWEEDYDELFGEGDCQCDDCLEDDEDEDTEEE